MRLSSLELAHIYILPECLNKTTAADLYVNYVSCGFMSEFPDMCDVCFQMWKYV